MRHTLGLYQPLILRTEELRYGILLGLFINFIWGINIIGDMVILGCENVLVCPFVRNIYI